MSEGIVLPRNHVALQCARDVDDILEPLKKTGVQHFTYMRNYDDRTQIYLSNNSEWIDDYYQNALYDSSFFQNSPENYKSEYVVWPKDDPSPVFELARNRYDSDNGITFVKRRKDYVEFYFFSSSVDNESILNFYVNNIDVIEQFILFFDDRAEAVIKKAEQTKILLPAYLYKENPKAQDFENMFLVDEHAIDHALKKMRIRKYRIKDGGFKGVKLSARELDSIFSYMSGKTAKETAIDMNISNRTVESYFENIKAKLGCYNKDEIVDILISDGFPTKLATEEER